MDVFDLYAKIGLDKSEYESGLKDAKGSMSSFASSVGNGLKTVAKVGATAIAAGAAGVAALTKMGVEGYAQYEQLVGGVDTLFKTANKTVMEYAENAYKTAGMSANEYMETVTSFSASLIQSLGGDTEKAAEVGNMAITDMSDNANKMGTSMEMIQNAYNGFAKQNYTMLDNLKLGYGGTKEEMQRLLDDASKISGIKYDISSFADVTEAIHVMQVEMGIAGTTAKEAASTIEGSLSMMKGAWQNLVVGMADENANMGDLINNFVESTVTAFGNLMPRIEQTLAGIGQLVEGLAPVIADALPGLVSSVLPSLLNAAIGLVNSVISAIPGLMDMLVTSVIPQLISGIVTAFNALVAMLPTLVESLVSALPVLIPQLVSGLVSMIVTLCTMFPQIIQPIIDYLPEIIVTCVNTLLDNLPVLLMGISQLIIGIIAALPQLISGLWESITTLASQFAQSLFGNIEGWIRQLFPKSADTVLGVLETIQSYFTMLVNNIGEILSVVWTVITTPFKLAWEGIKLVWDNVVAYFELIWNNIKAVFAIVDSVLSGDFKGAWDGIKQIWDNCVQYFKDIVNNVKTAFSNVFEILSEPFVKAKEAIGNIVENIYGFLVGLWQRIGDGVTAAWEWICGVLEPVGTWIYENVIAPVADFFKGLWEGIVNAWHTVIDPWIEIVKTLATMFYNNVIKPVADFFVNLWNGIKEGATAAWDGIKNVFSVVANWFDSTIITPVQNFFAGMWAGVKNGAKNAWDGITSVFSNVTNWFKDKFSQAWQAVKNVFSTGGKVFDGIKEGIVSVFKTVVNAIIGGINKVIAVPFNAINNILRGIRNIEIVGIKPFNWVYTFNVPQIPKLSTGLNFVPYDEYPAFLHRGEAVLTAAQARAWRNGQGGTALTGDNGQIMSVLISILNAITGGNAELLQAMLSGNTIVLNEREFARAVRTYA